MDEIYEAKHQIMGEMSWAQKSIKLLSIIITWERHGISLEADKKHTEEATREFGLEESKPVSTPGVREYEEDQARRRGKVEEERKRGSK